MEAHSAVCFVSCGCSVTRPYKQGKQPSGSSPSFLCSTRIRPPFLPCLNAFRLATSLSLLPQHSDIPTFYGIMSKIGEPKVRFLSLSSLQTSRGGLLLAESALFTLPLCCLPWTRGHSIAPLLFFSLCAFCHLANLFRSLSPAFLIKRAFSGPGRAFPRTSTRRPPLFGNVLVEARRIDSRTRPQVGTGRALMPNTPSTLASPRSPSFNSRAIVSLR